MDYPPQIHGRGKTYYIQYTSEMYERIIQCGAYVAYNESGCYVNNIFVISKHVDFLKNGYTKVSKCFLQINNLIHPGKFRNNT